MLFFFASLLLGPAPALCGASYQEELVQKARALELSRDRGWKSLLHYAKGYYGAERSRVGDPRFFLSPEGREDSEKELEATLASFFIPPQKDGEHSACRFPARYEWLKSHLAIDSSRLPPFTCSERDRTFAVVDAKSAVLVFPVGHVNSPASMFGHTLIRIDSSSKSSLISYAANYAAVTTDANGFIYAYKGLFGGYPGYFSMMPYYEKVKEYNDIEHRDMWEYPLKLSEEEVKAMLNHLWELQTIGSPYYFLDENCSYNLLFLMEAARPALHLTDRTGFIVLPTDTIRVAQESGILEEPHYRPSQGTRIKKILSLLDAKERRTAHRLALGVESPEELRREPLPDLEKMKIFDVAAEFAQVRSARKDLEKSAYSRLYLKLLSERSRLGAPPEELYRIPEPPRPESGHRTSRVALGAGVRRGEPFAEVQWQLAFHTLLDPDQGYLRGAQIEFFNTSVIYNSATEEAELKRLHLIDILSLAPRDVFFRSLSWRVMTGLDREPMSDGNDALVYRLNTGGGFAYDSPWGSILYALGEMDIAAGTKVRAGISVAPGVSAGDLEQITPWWKLHLSVRGFLHRLGDRRDILRLSAAQNFRVSRNNSISAEYLREYVNRHQIEEAGVWWNYYY